MSWRSSRTPRGDDTGLVRPILYRRLGNEVAELNRRCGAGLPPLPEDFRLPLVLDLTLTDLPAWAAPGQPLEVHRLQVIVSAEYPYERPRVRWLTPIFHPNIMAPADGGYVCVRLLDSWAFDSTLADFVGALAGLVQHPNAQNPFGTASCLAAAEWYTAHAPKVNASISYGTADE